MLLFVLDICYLTWRTGLPSKSRCRSVQKKPIGIWVKFGLGWTKNQAVPYYIAQSAIPVLVGTTHVVHDLYGLLPSLMHIFLLMW